MSERRLFASALALALTLHCVAYEPGIEVPVTVTGVAPTLGFTTADGELFWGNDRLEDALDWALARS